MGRLASTAAGTRALGAALAVALLAVLAMGAPPPAEAATGSISGTVTDISHQGIGDVCVSADGIGNNDSGDAVTDASGAYTVTRLGGGNFAVSFTACGAEDYVSEYFDDKASFEVATPVAVTDGQDTPGIDASLADGGSISGRVAAESTGLPLSGACVEVSGPTPATVSTGALGDYVVRNLAPGAYTVTFRGCGAGNFVTEFYDDATESGSAAPVAVVANAATADIDADLAPAGSIAGTVTDPDGSPQPNVCAKAHRVGSDAISTAETDASGDYQINRLATGDYKVEFEDCNGVGLVGEYYDDRPDQASADVVQVAAPTATTGIDAVLAIDSAGDTGSISGQVTDDSFAPLSGVCVTAYPDGGSGAPRADATDGSGDYEITGLAEDDYRVEFASCGAPGPVFITEYYDDQPELELADPVFVAAGSPSGGVDAALEVDPNVDLSPPQAPSITASAPSSPGNVNAPRLIGTAEPGSTVRIYPSSDCTGTPVTGTAAQFASPGIQVVAVTDNSTTSYTATATDPSNNTSTCSGAFDYTEDSIAPAAPTLGATSPTSPANDNNPEVSGTAEGGSTVRIYKTPNCTGTVAATAGASVLGGAGITVNVSGDATTTLAATATDAAGNTSPCSASLAYVEDSTPPAAPTIAATDPASPASDNSPKLKGSAASGSTIKVYATGDCTGTVLGSGTTAELEGAGIALSVPSDSISDLRATATDAAGNVSACSAARRYVEDSTAPTAAFSSGPSGTTNDASGAFGLRAGEVNVSFRCSLDAGAFSPCSATPSFGPLAAGPHTLAVTATDAAGNEGPAAERNWVVDPSAGEAEMSGGAAAGGVVTNDPAGLGPAAGRPATVAVTLPGGGSVTIVGLSPTALAPPSGYSLLGAQLDISAPAATASQPLRLDFRLDSSQIPAGTDGSLVTLLRNGSPAPDCLGSAQATPSPCVTLRTTLGDGDLRIVVLTAQASSWRFAVAQAPPPPPPTGGGGTGGYPPPSDPGGTAGGDGGGAFNPPTPAPQCVVPKLKGMSKSAAAAALAAARCTLGKVTKKKVKKGKSGKVLAQSPAAGQALAAGAPVGVTVSVVRKKK